MCLLCSALLVLKRKISAIPSHCSRSALTARPLAFLHAERAANVLIESGGLVFSRRYRQSTMATTACQSVATASFGLLKPRRNSAPSGSYVGTLWSPGNDSILECFSWSLRFAAYKLQLLSCSGSLTVTPKVQLFLFLLAEINHQQLSNGIH